MIEQPIAKQVPVQYNPIDSFMSYMLEFYGDNGVYNYGFTPDEILAGTIAYITTLKEIETFEGDSLDREAVRDIVLERRQAKLKQYHATLAE